MAISSIYNSLTFGGVNSADYGIYITGEGVYNAPKRAVDMVGVPGRNGAIAIDQGRWENIEIEYPAGTFGMNAEEFGTALSNFRNAIVSQIGYQRLTDTYHPDEYRMAMYVSGLDVSPKHYNSAGEFNLTFNCKPQRWLANGETAIVVASGDTLTNPTPYDAGPLLAVEGYGNIGFNGYTIAVDDGLFGNVLLLPAGSSNYPSYTKRLDASLYNAGDTITIPAFSVSYHAKPDKGSHPSAVTITSVSGAEFSSLLGTGLVMRATFPEVSFETSSTHRHTARCDFTMTQGGTTYTCYLTLTILYTASSASIVVQKSTNINSATSGNMKTFELDNAAGWAGIYVDSTKSYLGDPTYIDCEIGEAYKVENGEYISLNAYIALGSDLPILKSGANEITLDNTITELKVKPNWWRL
jgi:phage-related protein